MGIEEAPDTAVGGTSPAARNVISGNDGNGVQVVGSTFDTRGGNKVQGNHIGTDKTGTAPLGNATAGVAISEEVNAVVGGTSAGAANTIAFNAGDGVLVSDQLGPPDTTGNSVTGDTSEFSAATEVEDDTPPTVVSTNPRDGATGVAPTVNVTATFSERMDPATINGNSFRLFERVGATQQPVAAEVSYNATFRRGALRPDEPLSLGTRYVAKVTTGARDLAGNRLAQTETFTFVVRQ